MNQGVQEKYSLGEPLHTLGIVRPEPRSPHGYRGMKRYCNTGRALTLLPNAGPLAPVPGKGDT